METASFKLPRLYPILDRDVLALCNVDLVAAAHELVDAGCTLLQYRNKTDIPAVLLREARRVREQLPPDTCRLLLNDRPDLARLADLDGAHVGQTDLTPSDARLVLGPGNLLGLSTHTVEQFRGAIDKPVDYIAIGPIFATATKADADPAVGLGLLREIRGFTRKPIVAIGGINLENAPRVIEAGADSVAVISALVSPSADLAKNARGFLRALA